MFAKFFAPFLIETCFGKRFFETRAIRKIEHHAMGLEFRLHAVVQLEHVSSLQQGGLSQVFADQGLRILWQRLPPELIGQHPLAIPHVGGHGAVFLNLIQLGHFDDGQGILLTLDNFGLKG